MKNINRGQASLVMILVLAMAFIFYAVELNWGRLADFKISTWTAANTSASMLASNFASYGERVLWENLLNEDAQENWDAQEPTLIDEGTVKACQKTYLWLRILVAIIVLVIVILTYGTTAYLLVIVMAALYAASFILEYAYIIPMQMSMWNKLQQNLQPVDQMKESGVQTGIMALATDTVNLPDRFDMNGNGKWGFKEITKIDGTKATKANDTISRFSLFYTERLKLIGEKQTYYSENTTAAAYSDFRNALNGLVYNAATQPVPGLGHLPFCSPSNARMITKDLLIQSLGDDPDFPGFKYTDAFNVLLLNPLSSPAKWATQIDGSRIKIAAGLDLTDTVILDAIKLACDNAVPRPVNFDRLLPIMIEAQERSTSSPLCKSACTHSGSRNGHGYALGWDHGTTTASTQRYYVPEECSACSAAADTDNEFSPCPAFANPLPVDEVEEPVNLHPNNFRLLYSPHVEDPFAVDSDNLSNPSNAFRLRLGHDDEMGKKEGASNNPVEGDYDANRAKGLIFPMLASMDLLTPGHDGSNDIHQALSNASLSIPIGIPQFADGVVPMAIKALSTDCAAEGKNNDPAGGIYWKKGADQYCSGKVDDPAYRVEDPDNPGTLITEEEYYKNRPLPFGPLVFDQFDETQTPPAMAPVTPYHWPYSDCTYMHDADTGRGLFCPQGQPEARLWPQDRLDSLVYGLPKVIELNKYLRSLSTNQLNAGVNQWYPQIAQYVAPQCSATACTAIHLKNSAAVCGDGSFPGLDASSLAIALSGQKADAAEPRTFADDPAVCNRKGQGLMIQWWYDMKNWKDRLYTWLNAPVAADLADVCSGGNLPLIDPTGVVGCLTNKSLFYSDLQNCVEGVGDDLVNHPPFPAAEGEDLSYYCKKAIDEGFANGTINFMRAPLPGIVRPDATGDYAAVYPTDATNYPIIKDWVYTEWVVQKIINSRHGQISSLVSQTKEAMDLFQEGENTFYNFLAGPVDGIHPNANDLMKARQNQGESNTVVPTGSLEIENLPGFVIYGWRDNQKRTLDGLKLQQGFWHLTRMEVLQPDTLPTVRAFQEEHLFGSVSEIFMPDIWNCYQFENGAGEIFTRATRWDESKTANTPAMFANKKPIWSFNYGSRESATNLGTCDGLSNEDKFGVSEGYLLDKYCAGRRIGLTGKMTSALAAVSGCDAVADLDKRTCVAPLVTCDPDKIDEDIKVKEACDYKNAFMFNYDPEEADISNPIEKEAQETCWCLVNQILGTGIVSYSKATYGIKSAGGSEYHVQVRFDEPKEAKDEFPGLQTTISKDDEEDEEEDED